MHCLVYLLKQSFEQHQSVCLLQEILFLYEEVQIKWFKKRSFCFIKFKIVSLILINCKFIKYMCLQSRSNLKKLKLTWLPYFSLLNSNKTHHNNTHQMIRNVNLKRLMHSRWRKSLEDHSSVEKVLGFHLSSWILSFVNQTSFSLFIFKIFKLKWL